MGENEETEARTEELASAKRHNLRNRAGLKPPSWLKDFNQSEIEDSNLMSNYSEKKNKAKIKNQIKKKKKKISI